MNRRWIPIIIFAVFMSAVIITLRVVYTPSKQNDEVIVWQDAALEQIIRDYLDKPDGDVMVADVQGITTLDIRGNYVHCIIDNGEEYVPLNGVFVPGDIANLEYLVHFTSLEELSIMWNKISDLTPLAELEKLKHLTVEWNPIDDLSLLDGLDEVPIETK